MTSDKIKQLAEQIGLDWTDKLEKFVELVLAEPKDTAPVANRGRYGIKVPMDEDLKEWLFVVDMGTGVPIMYSTYEEADAAGKPWGYYTVEIVR